MNDKRMSPADFTIFIVNDAELSQSPLESALGKEWRVESFATAESCLARLNQHVGAPDLFLLGIDLPGMDGFALCRQIKQRQDLAHTPVIFVSGRDDLESRLEGFDAGGLDFLVKPINQVELKQKIGTACRISSERQSLNAQLHESETLTSLALSDLDEYAILIRFLRALNECEKPQSVVDELLSLLRAYHLQCSIQIRLPGLELTIGESGTNHPLETAVINHIRDMGPIFEFKRRAAFNFEHITILVNNVPHHDPELCSRLRKHVAIVGEYANTRLQSVHMKTASARAKGGVAELLEALKNTAHVFEGKYTLARYRGSELTLDMINEQTSAFVFLGISDDDTRDMLDLVHTKAKDLSDSYDFSSDTQKMLDRLAKQLVDILQSVADESAVPNALIAQSEYPDLVCHPDITSVEV